MKKILYIFILFFSSAIHAQEIPIPYKYTLLEEVKGDLTKDKIDEIVRVYNTSDSVEFGTAREIIIYKKAGDSWTTIAKSRMAVMSSEAGGMMGDPFESIVIIKGILNINHFGGSSWKWSITDKYRYQNNDFELIGCTPSYGKNGEYWMSADINFSTGKYIYTKEYEVYDEITEESKTTKTEKETFVNKELKLKLSDRFLKEHKIVSPVNKYEIYI